ncbi:hypothetical protein Gotur_004230, partial [Gossypium turneri]
MPSGSQAQVEVQRLRDQQAQMQATTVEQITQLKAEATSREVEVQRKYEELQLQLKEEATVRKQEAAVREAEAAAREAEQSKNYNTLQQQLENNMMK